MRIPKGDGKLITWIVVIGIVIIAPHVAIPRENNYDDHAITPHLESSEK